jgi:3-oxoacyl-[acyl-carrier protein] reductase
MDGYPSGAAPAPAAQSTAPASRSTTPGRLEGKIALITGASTGIGAGVALAFAKEGADVAINYPSEKDLDNAGKVAEEVQNLGKRAFLVMADVSKEDEVDAMVKAVLDHFGTLDILVNNAGILVGPAPIHEMEVESWDRLMSVNLRSVFLVTRKVLPHMLEKNNGGKIINTASQLAQKGAPTFAHYCTAKAGIIGFTRTLSLEIGDKKVNANCVAPGATFTPILADVPKEVLEAIKGEIPKKRIAEVDDIVPSYVFLASKDADHIVGQTISPNGGDAFF